MALLDRVADLLVGATRIIPPGLAWTVGGALGQAFSMLPMRDPRRCREHLAMAYPDFGAVWVERTARKTFRHMGGMALWSIAVLGRDACALRRGVMVEGADNVREAVRACRRGEGTVGFSGHFGNWELFARVGPTLFPVTLVGRRLRSPIADRLVQAARRSGGARVVYQDEDVRVALRELRSGRMLGALADQDVPRLAGVFVPWFGKDAYTPSAPAMLALMSGGAVQPVFLYRRGLHWVMHFGPRRIFPRTKDRAADIRAITAWAMAYEERLVRSSPHQWVWWHRRWRTRPDEVAARVP